MSNECKLHGWWERELLPLFSAAIRKVFLLTGNVNDVMPVSRDGRFVTALQLVCRELAAANTERIVVIYDKSGGCRFGDEILALDEGELSPYQGQEKKMRDRFMALVGLAEAQQNNPLAAQTTRNGLPLEPERVFPLLERALASDVPVTVIVDYVESIVREGDYASTQVVALQKWASQDGPVPSSNFVVLLERNYGRIAEALKTEENGIGVIHLPRPSVEEHMAFAQKALENHGVRLAAGMTAERLARLLPGLRHVDFDDMCLRAVESGSTLNVEWIWTQKRLMIESATDGRLRVVRPDGSSWNQAGGLEYVRAYLDHQIALLQEGSPLADLGLLAMGPSGTGKSLVARIIANLTGFAAVEFDLGGLKDARVGNSERNIRVATDILRAMVPVLVIVDEAAENVGSGNEYAGDSGVANSMRGYLQNFMDDPALRGRIFWYMATNWPSRMPAPMLQPHRLSKRVPFFPADEAGRADILQICLKKHANGVQPAQELDVTVAAQATDGYLGSELEEIALRAIQFAKEESVEFVTTALLMEAVGDFIPGRNQDAMQKMMNEALAFANSRRLLPPHYRDVLKVERDEGSGELKAIQRPTGRKAGQRL